MALFSKEIVDGAKPLIAARAQLQQCKSALPRWKARLVEAIAAFDEAVAAGVSRGRLQALKQHAEAIDRRVISDTEEIALLEAKLPELERQQSERIQAENEQRKAAAEVRRREYQSEEAKAARAQWRATGLKPKGAKPEWLL